MASSSAQLLKEARACHRKGEKEQALALLRSLMRGGEFDAGQADQAGRLIQKLRHDEPQDGSVKIRILGQCTTSWLVNAVDAVSWGRGISTRVTEGEYDNVMQEVMSPTEVEQPSDIVVLLPWHQRIRSKINPDPEQRLHDELSFWKGAWSLVKQRKSRLIQIGYDWDTTGALGVHLGGRDSGDIGVIRRLNTALREALPEDAFFIDLEHIAGSEGHVHFYDRRRYHWTKQPFSELGTVRLAEHIVAGIRALVTGPKKVLAVDLDNTLWGGVVGETGPLGIVVGESPDGEAHLAFQQYVKALTERGVVLAVCSKNNPADAREPFEKNPHLALRLDDFAAFEANWEPKSASLRRIAEQLRLGLDSFVFVDDSPTECEEIRQALPEVEVVHLPEDPADYVAALEQGLWFEAVSLTSEDQARSRQYKSELDRREYESSCDSLDGYLESLDLTGDVREIGPEDLDRVVQLIGKTNQFNLTTRRHSREAVLAKLQEPDAIGLTLRVADRFGDYGLTSVILAVREAEATLRIDTWLMSCRVIGRTVEEFLFGAFLERARRQGVRRIVGEFIPTAKNAIVSGIFERFGFVLGDDSREELVRYHIECDDAEAPKTFVSSIGSVE